jgi:lipid II:glycine glycyltransferase (peptidoglycan interpeptide bridge formation enzyme)
MYKKAGFTIKKHIYFPEYESPHNITGFSKNIVHTAELSLTNSEDIWNNLEKETRNIIRKAQKENVIVRKAESQKDLEEFYKIRLETLNRTGLPITGKELDYFNYCLNKDWNTIYVAEKEGTILGGFVLLKAGNKTHYSSPATNELARKIGVSNLLIWKGIEDSINGQYKKFDFWGIVTDKTHPQYSITRFKKSFNPLEVPVEHFSKGFL